MMPKYSMAIPYHIFPRIKIKDGVDIREVEVLIYQNKDALNILITSMVQIYLT